LSPSCASRASEAEEAVAAVEHVVERAEGHHVVAAVVAAFDAGEGAREVDGAFAQAQVPLRCRS
jgi:hypothetical protein